MIRSLHVAWIAALLAMVFPEASAAGTGIASPARAADRVSSAAAASIVAKRIGRFSVLRV